MRETDLTTSDGLTLYQTIRRQSDGQYWTGSVFEAFNAAHWTSYAQALAKLVISAGTQANYHADFPALAAGTYLTDVFVQAGSSPAVTDGPPRWTGEIEWDGSAEIVLSRISAKTDGLQFDGNGFLKSAAQSLPNPSPAGYGATTTSETISASSESVRVG